MWASNPTFKIEPNEVAAIVAAFNDSSALAATGLFINRVKYMVVSKKNTRRPLIDSIRWSLHSFREGSCFGPGLAPRLSFLFSGGRHPPCTIPYLVLI